jgi:hypothetical protein
MSQYMQCIASSIGPVVIRRGTYSLVVSVDGTAPRRHATIVDGWGGLQSVTEDEDGHWRLVAGDAGLCAEFVPA